MPVGRATAGVPGGMAGHVRANKEGCGLGRMPEIHVAVLCHAAWRKSSCQPCCFSWEEGMEETCPTYRHVHPIPVPHPNQPTVMQIFQEEREERECTVKSSPSSRRGAAAASAAF